MEKCALKITHIGEQLFAKALNDNSELMKVVVGSEEKYKAFAEAVFTDKDGNNHFDGEHKIDVLLIPEDNKKAAIAIELKLGNTRMKANKSEFGRFLTGYQYGKRGKFIGSMISILNQKNATRNGKTIAYPLKYKEYNISDAWALIVLNNNIAKELKGNKDLWENKIPRILSFEELFNGVCKLNSYVSDLIHSENYYKTWLGK